MIHPPSLSGRRARISRFAAVAAISSGLLSAVMPAGAASASSPTGSNTPQWVPGRLLVQPRPGLPAQELERILKAHGGKSVGRIDAINVHIIQLPPNVSEKAVAALLAKNPHIKFAERDMRVKADGTANDYYFSSEWHLTKIGATTAWDTSSGAGITVAVLDSGVDASHPDLQSQLVPGWNFYDNNPNTADVTGHGTAVAGTVAAATNNSVGVASIAYGAKVMPVRISDTTGYAYFSTTANALTWAADQGAKVANISYSGMAGSSTVQSAAQYLKNKGGETVVSAGNAGANEGYSASSSLLAVSATDSNDVLTSWSSYGNYVDLSAPGLNILSTESGGAYCSCWGTSFSSPIVAATVALMMAAHPGIAPSTIENLLFSTATDLGSPGWDMYYGWGRVNAAAAVQAAKTASTGDTTPPTVSLTAPTNGSTVSGLVAVSVNASDNVGVSRVDLLVNGTKLASDTTAPYGFSWDSSKVPNGGATLVAYAYDAAGNYASSGISVNVANTATPTTDTTPPVATISNPANGAKVSGNVNVQASATDNVGVSGMNLYIDGQLASSVSGAGLSYNWKAQRIAAGSHTIKVEAKDAAGNIGSQSIQVVK